MERPEIGKHASDLLSLQYPVLSDAEHRVAERYGVYNLLGDRLATPSVFVVGVDGTIRWCYVGQDTRDRPTNEMILDELRELPPPS